MFRALMRIIARSGRKKLYLVLTAKKLTEHQRDGEKHLSSVQFSSMRLKRAPHHFLTMTHPIWLIYFFVFLYCCISLFCLNYLLYVFCITLRFASIDKAMKKIK